MKKIIRIGTRGSPLALIQAEQVKKNLFSLYPDHQKNLEIEIVPIRTSGDWKPEQKEQSFLDLGGNKGLFTKEIEEALLTNYIDIAVHSMKDVASWLPESLEIAVTLPRLDPRDAFICGKAPYLEALPKGSTVGTSSLRRQAQILAKRPDLKVISLRGNVETRLQKLADGVADATLLAVAGLTRLGAAARITSIMETGEMLPAASQGAIGIEIRSEDTDIKVMLSPLNCEKTFACVLAERAFLKILDGSCHTPIAALATITGKDIKIEALAAKPDGTSLIRMSHQGSTDKAETVGTELGHKMKSKLPPDFFSNSSPVPRPPSHNS